MVYTITFDATQMDEYQRGLASGVMYMATGMPEQTFAWARSHDKTQWFKTLECTEEQLKSVVEVINHILPGVIVSVS